MSMSPEDRVRQLRDLVAPSLDENDLDMLDMEISERDWRFAADMALSAAATATPPIIVPVELRELTTTS